ncbi:MAG: sensor histidine kinase [Myxococcota bacterium]
MSGLTDRPPTANRMSLSTRIFLAFSVMVACSGAASFYGIAAVTSLRHELGFLRQRALPMLDDMRRSGTELRGFDEALQRAAPHDLEWVVRFVPNAKPYPRVERILARTRALRDSSEPPRLARLLASQPLPLPVLDSRLAALRGATDTLARMAQDKELVAAVGGFAGAKNDAQAFDGLVAGLQRAITERRLTDAARIVVEIRRMIRHVHGALGMVERDFEQTLDARFEEAERSESRLSVLVPLTSVLALVISIGMLLAMLATLRPLTALTDVVRRFAGGDRKTRAATVGAAEIGTLAHEWNRMADSLALREAELGAQREDMARSERLAALGHMAARMAHEVRNPLSSIGLNAELLDEELGRGPELDATEARGLVRSISDEVERLRGVTERYLDRARPAQGEPRRLDAAEIVRSLTEFVRSELERRGVTVHLELARGVMVEADPSLVRQALWNLVRNAWEAMPGGGDLWLEVSVRRSGSGEPTAVLAIEDSGLGVPEAQRETIFQPFTTTKDRGTGIGLALVREVATAHRGRIDLVAGQHGSGARFELELPQG